ncbi:hypothetical protein ACET3Z_028540 [Daucus carota]
MANSAPPCSSDETLTSKFDNTGWEYGDLVDPASNPANLVQLINSNDQYLYLKNKKLKDKCDPLLANDARMAKEWIIWGGDNDESQGSTYTCDETFRELDEDDFNAEEYMERDEILCLVRWIKIVGDMLKV